MWSDLVAAGVPSTCFPATLEADAEIGLDLSGHEIEHLFGDARKHADPERVVHDPVGVREASRNAVVAADHRRLSRQIAGEQQPRADLVLIEIFEQLDSP